MFSLEANRTEHLAASGPVFGSVEGLDLHLLQTTGGSARMDSISLFRGLLFLSRPFFQVHQDVVEIAEHAFERVFDFFDLFDDLFDGRFPRPGFQSWL